MLRRILPRHRPPNWQMNRGVEIPNFPRGPENTYFIAGAMPDPSHLARFGPTYPATPAPSVPESPTQPEPSVRVELVRVYDPPPPAPVAAQPPAEQAPQQPMPAAEPSAPPVPDAPPPKPKKKHKKRPRRERPLTPDEEFALVQKGVSVPITHHERLCVVCRNPLREAIEEEFVHWHNVHDIADHYRIDSRAIYRHARAVNLYDKRDRNLRFALGHIIQRAQDVRITADSVIRAVHHFARINRDGHWVEPPTHIIVSSGSSVPALPLDPPPADAIDVAPPGDELPNQLDTPDE